MRTTTTSPRQRDRRRRGTILPMTALCISLLCGFCALALDLGVLAVARTQCQNAADAASLASTRALDNKLASVNSNQAAALAAANAVAQANPLLGGNLQPANVTSVRYGVYDYNPAAVPQQFEVSYPAAPAAGRSWTATEVTVNATHNTFFGKVFGTASLNTGARAVAVFRPRDIAMILDMTGSMKYGCMVKGNEGYMSSDPLYPQAGHWNRYTGYLANNPGTGTNGGGSPAGRHNPFFTTAPYNWGQVFAPTSFTTLSAGGPACVKDFFYDPANLANPSAVRVVPTVANLRNAFHHWDPTLATPGDPDNYIAQGFNYSGWNGTKDFPNFVVYPTPDTFGDQSDANYAGDLYARKRGAERTASPGSWDVTAANGAAWTLAEYLGWTDKYTGGAVPNATSNTTGFVVPGRANAGTGIPTTKVGLGRVAANSDYQTDWSDFRDAAWEQYGYDLDVNAYVANRGSGWDPRKSPASLPGAARQVTPGRFKGYSMGPGYWGKSFFVWPPDPRAPVGNPGDVSYQAGDWRRRYFYNTSGNALDPNADNNPGGGNALDNINEVLLTNLNGETLTLPGANQINYAAILKWIKQPPMAVPPNLRAGRVVYYMSIPDDVNTATGTADEQRDKFFWRTYIDYVLRDNNMMNYESAGWPDDNGATVSTIYQNPLNQFDLDGAGPTAPDPRPYMNYMDNPSRPRANFWFGPISMMSMLGDYNSWAGTTHETQTWQLKAGVSSVLDDIRNNHPNDAVGLCYFTAGGYGFTSVACGQEFNLLKASLFYPKPLVDSGEVWSNPAKEFVAFDAFMNWQGYSLVNNAQGGTDPNTGFAVGFNILAPSTTATPAQPPLPPAPYANQTAVRRGRRGAAKIAIFETDGVPNNSRQVTYQAAGFNSYYTINTSAGGGTPDTSALAVVDQIVAPMSNTASGNSGLSTPSSPAKVYSIGFGDLFSLSTGTATSARTFLLNVQKRGGTSASGDSAIPAYQIITGGYQTRITSLKTAFERILQSGVQVTLIE